MSTYTVITRGAFETPEGATSPQRITFTDAEAALRYAKQSEAAWTMYGSSKVERTELVPTLATVLRITLVDKASKRRYWIEVRNDLPFRPGTSDLK